MLYSSCYAPPKSIALRSIKPRCLARSSRFRPSAIYSGYKPNIHVLISDGCFHESGMLTVVAAIEPHALEQLESQKILKLLLSEGRITAATVALMVK